ncbi:hypothetical protein FIA58_002260 [Flavobacterium jejuense]|uniref:DUF4397 domain-containing protein n=1 Tax=Flavobacterium jejuense TaxID=1544455 RepID=A0ABX0IKZ6_9FLAO|nr:hypothetical protein [Flavobacterium jejuense]NHN24487.1 hypothetical protein [Flavobacterium jejuense]
MKKCNLFIVLLIAVLAISCSSDNDNTIDIQSNTGELIVNGQTYSLTKGFLIPNYTGTDPNYDQRRFYFILTNGDVTLNNNEFVYSNNITQLIDFNMYTSVQNLGAIENTTYPVRDYTDFNFNSDIAYIDHSGVNTNVIIQNNQYVSSDEVSTNDLTGQATMVQNNGIYTITFSYSNAQYSISGNYTGTLTDLNFQY